jgi:hypothetical protein
VTHRRLAPPWRDQDAVRAFVSAEIDELRLEIERLETIYPGHLPKLSEDLDEMHNLVTAEANRAWRKIDEAMGQDERAAVEAALRGDLEPLANSLRPFAGILGFPDEVNPAIKKLSPETWLIIAQFLTGARNLKTGKLKGERGPREKSEDDRRRGNPVHDAADLVPVVTAILRRLYPTKGRLEVKRRAIEVAARLRGAQTAPLKKHLSRGRDDRRRVR